MVQWERLLASHARRSELRSQAPMQRAKYGSVCAYNPSTSGWQTEAGGSLGPAGHQLALCLMRDPVSKKKAERCNSAVHKFG